MSRGYLLVAGFIGGAAAAATYCLIALVIYRALRAQRQENPR